MRCRLIKLENLSGYKASVYSVLLNNENETLFENFLKENYSLFLNETKDIIQRLITIANKTGAREDFFKHWEGRPRDGVCVLYDKPGSKLRLYCIRFGTQIIIIGGGGPKSRKVKSFQESEKLKKENYFLRWLSEQISNRIKDREIVFDDDYITLTGNLLFDDED